MVTASTATTLLDIVKRNNSDGEVGLIDETIKAHPELTLGEARTIKGLSYETRVRVALGRTTGSFRKSNKGTPPIKHRYEKRKIETFILEPRFECDQADADSCEDGPEAYIAEENSGILEGEWQGICRTFYYGRNKDFGNPDGFPGLIDSYDDDKMCVDAGGITDDTATSVWMVEFGPQAVRWVWGMDGQLKFSPLRTESLTDSDGNKYDGYVQTMKGRPGLQVGSLLSAVRIKKLTKDAGKGLTDDLINEGLSKFPAGHQPSVILMSRRSAFQLMSSRTATNPTGAPAPMPTSIQGLNGTEIPIRITDSIAENEKLAM